MRTGHGVTVLAIAGMALLAAACKGTEPGQQVDTGSECGKSKDCTLTDEASFTVTLVSTSCTATGNIIKVTQPVQETLTDDACGADPQTSWDFPGPFPAGTELQFSISSQFINSTPTFRVSGNYPDWTLTFEDGGDDDFNDVVLAVHATAVTP